MRWLSWRPGSPWLQAAQLALLAVIDTDPVTVSLPGVADKHWAVEDVGCALRLSPGVARARLAEAAQAVRMPQLLELLARGAISLGHVRVLTEATFGLTQEQLGAVAERVLARAAEQSVGAFRAAVRRAVLAVDARTQRGPAAGEHRRAARRAAPRRGRHQRTVGTAAR